MKLVLKAFWKNRYWLVAFAFAWWNLGNVILNSGYIHVTFGAVEYYYYFGFSSGTAGILAGILLGVVYFKSRTYILAHRVHPADRGDLFNDPHPPVSPGTNNAYLEITKYE